MSLFDDMEVSEQTLNPFWTPQIGTNQIIIVETPSEAREVELPKGSGTKQSRLFYTILDSFGVLKTWTVRYVKKVTTASLLGQLYALQKENKLKKGSLIELTRVGSGQSSRYSVKFLKSVDEKKLDEKLAEIEKKRKEQPKETKSPDLDKLF